MLLRAGQAAFPLYNRNHFVTWIRYCKYITVARNFIKNNVKTGLLYKIIIILRWSYILLYIYFNREQESE